MRKEKQLRKKGDTPGAMLNKEIEASPSPSLNARTHSKEVSKLITVMPGLIELER